MKAASVQKFGRFAFVGIAATLTHTAVAAGLIERFDLAPAPANGIAFCVATLVSYLLNTRWSFRQALGGRSLARFVVVALAGCALAGALSGAVDALGYDYGWGILAVVLLLPPLTFLAHYRWTYR